MDRVSKGTDQCCSVFYLPNVELKGSFKGFNMHLCPISNIMAPNHVDIKYLRYKAPREIAGLAELSQYKMSTFCMLRAD